MQRSFLLYLLEAMRIAVIPVIVRSLKAHGRIHTDHNRITDTRGKRPFFFADKRDFPRANEATSFLVKRGLWSAACTKALR